MRVIRDRQNRRVKFALVAVVVAAVRSGVVSIGVIVLLNSTVLLSSISIFLGRRSLLGLISLDRLVFGGLDSGGSVGGCLCDGGRHLGLGRLSLGGWVGHFFCSEVLNGKVRGGIGVFNAGAIEQRLWKVAGGARRV